VILIVTVIPTYLNCATISESLLTFFLHYSFVLHSGDNAWIKTKLILSSCHEDIKGTCR